MSNKTDDELIFRPDQFSWRLVQSSFDFMSGDIYRPLVIYLLLSYIFIIALISIMYIMTLEIVFLYLSLGFFVLAIVTISFLALGIIVISRQVVIGYWNDKVIQLDDLNIRLVNISSKSFLVDYYEISIVNQASLVKPLFNWLNYTSTWLSYKEIDNLKIGNGKLEIISSKVGSNFVSDIFDIENLNQQLRSKINKSVTENRSNSCDVFTEFCIPTSTYYSEVKHNELIQAIHTLLLLVISLIISFAILYYLSNFGAYGVLWLLLIVPILIYISWAVKQDYISKLQGLTLSPYSLGWNSDWLGVAREGKLLRSVELAFSNKEGLLQELKQFKSSRQVPNLEEYGDEIDFSRLAPAPLIHREEISNLRQDDRYLYVETSAGTQTFPCISDEDFTRVREWAGC